MTENVFCLEGEKTMQSFDEVWSYLQTNLKVDTKIKI